MHDYELLKHAITRMASNKEGKGFKGGHQMLSII